MVFLNDLITHLQKVGNKAKLPEWGGYWYGAWDEEGKLSIRVRTKEGADLNTPESKYLLRTNWILY